MKDEGKNILGMGESKCKVLKLNLTILLSKEQEGAIGPGWRELQTESQGTRSERWVGRRASYLKPLNHLRTLGFTLREKTLSSF